VRNPYALDRTACGSSAGSGAAIAASLAAAAIGTETDGSIICPSAMQGLVGLKPTVDLISRSGLVPISRAQDTAGPMARSIADLAAVLTVIAATDAHDPATAKADQHKSDYATAVTATNLTGRRFGVLRYATGNSPQTDIVFAEAVATLKRLGAQIVELDVPDVSPETRAQELSLMLAEFKTNIDLYLQRTPAGVPVKCLSEVIAYNKNGARDVALFGQDLLEVAEKSGGAGSAHHAAMSRDLQLQAGPNGIDRLLAKNGLDALIAPSVVPAGRTDLVRGDPPTPDVSRLPAIAGYPHLTVPMGNVSGLPVGLSFIGTAWSERELLAYGAAFEHETHARRAPGFPLSIDTTAALGQLASPVGSQAFSK
jgi:amidase